MHQKKMLAGHIWANRSQPFIDVRRQGTQILAFSGKALQSDYKQALKKKYRKCWTTKQQEIKKKIGNSIFGKSAEEEEKVQSYMIWFRFNLSAHSAIQYCNSHRRAFKQLYWIWHAEQNGPYFANFPSNLATFTFGHRFFWGGMEKVKIFGCYFHCGKFKCEG